MAQVVRDLQRKNGLVFGKMKQQKNNRGFTLLEILIVVAIIGVVGAVIMPNMQKATPRYEREEFIARFNALAQLAWQQALVLNKVQRIHIDINKKLIFLQSATGEKDRSGEPAFITPTQLAVDVSFALPDQIVIKQFFVEGFDMMAKFTSSKTEEMWFYIMPEGVAQDVIINFLDKKDTKNDAPRHVGLVLNPFTVQFKVYDAFQKP